MDEREEFPNFDEPLTSRDAWPKNRNFVTTHSDPIGSATVLVILIFFIIGFVLGFALAYYIFI